MEPCRKYLFCIVSLVALTAGCAPESPPVAPPAAAAAAAPAQVIDIAGMDRSVAPGDDFNAYASGTWLANNEIPADRNAYGTTGILVDLTRERVSEIVKGLADSKSTLPAESAKVRDYYTAFMDEAGIEAKGLQPLAADLARIDGLTDKTALAREIGAGLRADVDMLNATAMHTDNLFGLWVAQDLDDPARYATFLVQGGLTMLDRAYYVDNSPRMVEIRAKYQAHVANVLRLAGIADETAVAKRIVALETAIARVHWKREDNTNVARANNHWKRTEFARRAPGLDWAELFTAARLADREELVVWQPEAVRGIAKLVASQPLATWKEYLKFHAIESNAAFLPKAFVDEAFAFHGTAVQGTPELRARWKRAVDATSDALGMPLGKLYVEKWFSPEAKARAEEMVHNLIAALGARIDKLEWMAPQTKAKAKAKLATLKVGVGYPDEWLDYSSLVIAPDDAIGNRHRVELFEYELSLAKLGKPVDRAEWVMTPQTVNAVNLPVMNAMNFPAAILQPPYFDTRRPVAMDYGATGALIGHEITHSFDNTGAQFDAEGRLQNWWTKEDLAHFTAAGQKLIAQFDAYKPLPDLAINGKQTLGENIADVAGLNVAYDGYRLSQEGKPAVSAEGLTGEQLFFISYAQSWREKQREPFLRQLIVADGHAPDSYRAASVRNLDAWYEAFDVKPGQKLYLAPEERVRVW